jgi:hypothetical protein
MQLLGSLVLVYKNACRASLYMPSCDEVFVTRKEQFVVSDDWVIKPASTSSTLSTSEEWYRWGRERV